MLAQLICSNQYLKFHIVLEYCFLSLSLTRTILSPHAFFFSLLCHWLDNVWLSRPTVYLTAWICLTVFLVSFGLFLYPCFTSKLGITSKKLIRFMSNIFGAQSLIATHQLTFNVWVTGFKLKRCQVVIAWFLHYKFDIFALNEYLFHHNLSYNGLSINWSVLSKLIISLRVIK